MTMHFSPLIDELINALRCLPGVGPRSAQRMAFYLLDRGKANGRHLAKSLTCAIDQIGHCEQCRILTETAKCRLCTNFKRDASLLCVVESPADVVAIEQAGCYHGLYFVLGGHLSPIDGIGPEEIGIAAFKARLASGGTIKEVIMATNSTVEGEATAYYLAEITKTFGILASRIAHGIPMGGELEYLDGGTVLRALEQRYTLEEKLWQ